MSIRSLIRNKLTHDKVSKLLFVHMNIKPMDGVDMSEEHQDFFLDWMLRSGLFRLHPCDAADLQRHVGDHRNPSSEGAFQGKGLGKRSEDYKGRRRQECHQDKATDERALARMYCWGRRGVG